MEDFQKRTLKGCNWLINNQIHPQASTGISKHSEFPNFAISKNGKKWKKNNKKTLSGFDYKIYQTIKANKGLSEKIENERSEDVVKKEREGLRVRKQVEKVNKIKNSLTILEKENEYRNESVHRFYEQRVKEVDELFSSVLGVIYK